MLQVGGKCGVGGKAVTIIRAGLPVVHGAVSAASAQIVASDPLVVNWTINKAWNTHHCVGGPHWSSVMTSKTLHFMTRALGVVDDCPVPLDGKITIKTLWPSFQARVDFLRKHHGIHDPTLTSIKGGGIFNDYNRYMTAIIICRNRKNAAGGRHRWTTTDVETTIFGMKVITWILS